MYFKVKTISLNLNANWQAAIASPGPSFAKSRQASGSHTSDKEKFSIGPPGREELVSLVVNPAEPGVATHIVPDVIYADPCLVASSFEQVAETASLDGDFGAVDSIHELSPREILNALGIHGVAPALRAFRLRNIGIA